MNINWSNLGADEAKTVGAALFGFLSYFQKASEFAATLIPILTVLYLAKKIFSKGDKKDED